MTKDLLIDPGTVDFHQITATQEDIRRFNPQRFEMEQVTAICLEDQVGHLCIGYKDITDHDFWVRGHMPGMPLMPGVMMIEAAAQICSYYVHKYSLLGPGVTVGMGGLDEVRFREPVRPGDRLILAAKLLKLRPRMMVVCHFQAYVGEKLVCEGQLKGVALPTDELANSTS